MSEVGSCNYDIDGSYYVAMLLFMSYVATVRTKKCPLISCPLVHSEVPSNITGSANLDLQRDTMISSLIQWTLESMYSISTATTVKYKYTSHITKCPTTSSKIDSMPENWKVFSQNETKPISSRIFVSSGDKTFNKHAQVHGSEKRDLLFLTSRKVIWSPRSGLVKVPNRGHVNVCWLFCHPLK